MKQDISASQVAEHEARDLWSFFDNSERCLSPKVYFGSKNASFVPDMFLDTVSLCELRTGSCVWNVSPGPDMLPQKFTDLITFDFLLFLHQVSSRSRTTESTHQLNRPGMSTIPSRAAFNFTDFARLQPVNKDALLAFDHLVRRMMDDFQRNPAARKYISIRIESLDFADYPSDNDSSLNPAELTGQRIWTGFYRLDLARPRTQPSLGRIIDGGKYAGGADILVTEQNYPLISVTHGRINHDYKSGAFILSITDGHHIIVDSKTIVDRCKIRNRDTKPYHW